MGQRALSASRRSAHEPRIQQLHDDLARIGLRPFHVPLGIMLDEARPAQQPLHPLRHLRRLPVPGPREERRPGRLRRSGARASERHAADRTPTSRGSRRAPSGREVTGVVVERNGDRATSHRPTSSSSSCGAINSAALLLRSANDRHPDGLANGSDVVGRHYMGHVNSVLLAISKTPNPTVFQKTLA